MIQGLHKEIQDKLDGFRSSGKIPNIVFHGPSGSGKRTIVGKFISDLYRGDRDLIRQYVLEANCAHGKGIKFVREELKFFAKANHNTASGVTFKSVVLSNADSLTIDAQSALRRCIEQFSHTTRFFMIVHDKFKLLRPILSRFSDVCVPRPDLPKFQHNLHIYNLEQQFGSDKEEKRLSAWLKKKLTGITDPSCADLMALASCLYEKGYSGIDILRYIENDTSVSEERKTTALLAFDKVKRDFRNEKLYMIFVLNYWLARSDQDLENLVIM